MIGPQQPNRFGRSMPTDRRRLVAAAVLMACGCLAHKIRLTETGAPRYEQVEIRYEVTDGRGALAVIDSHGSKTPVEFAAAGDEPGWNAARLRISYPHPEANEALARATLRLSRRPDSAAPGNRSLLGRLRSAIGWSAANTDPSSEPGDAEESLVRVLEFPKQDLDLLLVDLAKGGFFDDQRRPEAAAHLSVTIDRGRAEKTWTPEPRLEDLVLRVYRFGRPPRGRSPESFRRVGGGA